MLKLKAPPAHIQPFTGCSDLLIVTEVPAGSDPRKWYLENPSSMPGPCISSSEFVPEAMIEHLMRNKKDSALGVKFQARRTPPDQITNMEGALHTFVTPLVQACIHGDYAFRGGHRTTKFPPVNNFQQARVVVISAQIQLDFEGPDVMLELAALKEDQCVGLSLLEDFTIPRVAVKQIDKERAAYDISLKRHMVQHLTKEAFLNSIQNAHVEKISTVDILEGYLEHMSETGHMPMLRKFVRLPTNQVLSLELLFQAAIQQLRNELSALEALCPQGYVYTSDPPSIFAREIGTPILNRLHFAALSYLASGNKFSNMMVYAFNDYAEPGAIRLIKEALRRQRHVMIVSKKDLFLGPGGVYAALPGTQGALLVIHNNSDGFGQNIETEWESGSLDGAIGANSSAAASLKRDRLDLVANLM